MKAGKKTKAFPLAVYAMVIGAFAVGADEFIVAGVIREIANALSVTIGQAGLLESAYALGVAIGAPLFTVLGLRLPRRRMLLISIGVFVVGNLISALGPTYSVIMVGRLVAASGETRRFGVDLDRDLHHWDHLPSLGYDLFRRLLGGVVGAWRGAG